MYLEIGLDKIRRLREKRLTVEEIIIHQMYDRSQMSAAEIGDVLKVKPQTIRAMYIRACNKIGLDEDI
ncbi:MAG: hypothetical protein KAS66_08205 [Candidatus Omnitrophica bacterium]|nr:hypothetical protein [Candidatus Omnitrophota bacterium]